MTLNDLSYKVIGCALKVHREVGPGLLESVYRECLYYELTRAGLCVEKEKPVPLVYRGVKFDVAYRLDLFVEEKLIVELKSVDALAEVHLAQLLTYLRLMDCHLGLLINFNVPRLREGIRRVIL